MKITITSTKHITELGGVPVRVWEGTTEKGTHCKVFVHRVAVEKGEDTAELQRELREELPPGEAIDLRQIL